MDDEVIGKARGHEIGSVLDALSVTELEARIVLLEAEIERLRAAIGARGQTLKAAEALFKL
jgi:uncharacterized small protein (DUF1192 family)